MGNTHKCKIKPMETVYNAQSGGFTKKGLASGRGRDLASNPSAPLFERAIVVYDSPKNYIFLDHFTPFMSISENFWLALLFKKTGNFGILAKSLRRGPSVA